MLQVPSCCAVSSPEETHRPLKLSLVDSTPGSRATLRAKLLSLCQVWLFLFGILHLYLFSSLTVRVWHFIWQANYCQGWQQWLRIWFASLTIWGCLLAGGGDKMVFFIWVLLLTTNLLMVWTCCMLTGRFLTSRKYGHKGHNFTASTKAIQHFCILKSLF